MDSYTLKNLAHYARAVLTDTGLEVKSQSWDDTGPRIGRSTEDDIYSIKPNEYNYRVSDNGNKKAADLESLYNSSSSTNVSGLLESTARSQSSAPDTKLLLQKHERASSPVSDSPLTSAFGCFTTCCTSSDLDGISNTRNVLIPYARILNARELGTVGAMRDSHLIELSFAVPYKKDLVPKRQCFIVQSLRKGSVVETILNRSYENVRRNKSLMVIINPFSGKGKAKKLYLEKCHPILKETGWNIDITYTEYPQHATDIARTLDLDKYDTVVCASGDGIPYEVINGLYQRPDRVRAFNELTVTQLPCGSGNAMSISCHWTGNPSYAAMHLTKSRETWVDVMCCTQSDGKGGCDTKLSFLSQTYGVIAESDINTEWIRWMGPIRFDLGVAFTVVQGRKYPCDVYVKYAAKHKHDLHNHYKREKQRHLNNLLASSSSESLSTVSRSPSPVPSPSSSSSSSSSSLQVPKRDNEYKVTEADFRMQYTMENTSTLPDGWEQVNPDITENLQIFYTGKMPYVSADTNFFPTALPNDGTIDLVITDSRTPFSRMSSILLNLDKGSHVLQPEVVHAKVTANKLVPRPLKKSVISVDGERFPVEPLLVEVMPRLVKTLLRDGNFIDTEFESILD